MPSDAPVIGATIADAEERRAALAREAIALVRRALPPASKLEIVLAQDAAPDSSAPVRVVEAIRTGWLR
jgi:hypothetical protein